MNNTINNNKLYFKLLGFYFLLIIFYILGMKQHNQFIETGVVLTLYFISIILAARGFLSLQGYILHEKTQWKNKSKGVLYFILSLVLGCSSWFIYQFNLNNVWLLLSQIIFLVLGCSYAFSFLCQGLVIYHGYPQYQFTITDNVKTSEYGFIIQSFLYILTAFLIFMLPSFLSVV